MQVALSSIFAAACVLAVLAPAPVTASHEPGHGPCGCVAASLGFTINCNAAAFITEAFNALSSCTSCSVGSTCYRNYIIVQAHHDHCPTSSLPAAIQTGFHTYEAMCGDGCYIARQFVASLPVCPAPACTSPATVTSAVQTLNASCTVSCASAACATAYRTLRAAHDGCDEDDVPSSVETAIHDFDNVCAAQECNMVTAAFNPNTCETSSQSGATAPIVTPSANAYGRLLATDAVDNQVFTFDIDSGSWHMQIVNGIVGGSTLPTATADGRFAVATSRGGDAIQFLDTGMRLVQDPHGSVVVRGPPSLAAASFSSESPGHVESRFGWVVVFFDGTLNVARSSPNHQGSLAVAFLESQLGLPIDQVQPRVIFRDFAQHGNAWPTGDCRFIRSISVANNSLPNSFEMVDLNGNVLQSFPNACVRYHGYTAINGFEVAGCGSRDEGAGHVMVLQYQASAGRSNLMQMSYPHPNLRSGTIYGNADMSYAIGNYGSTPLGYNGIIRITPTKGTIDNATDVLFFPREAWPVTATGARSTCAMGMQQGSSALFLAALPDGYLYIYRSDNFSVTPIRVDLFPETRANLTRAMYSCTGAQAIRLEIGSRYAFVLRTVLDPARLMRIDLDLGVADSFITLPSGLPGSAIGDMIVAVPETPQTLPCVSNLQSSTSNTNTQGSGAGSSSSSSDDNRATIALAVLLGVAILALIVLGVAFFSHARRSQQLLHTKFSNPNASALSAL
eukprot:m.95245 g.95245  ORF g.95245 m.95245 type:complete len:733 (+) comp13887_c1_seq2:516-2714(+)